MTTPPKRRFCTYCGAELFKGKNRTIDHFKPLSKGGLNTRDNRVPCCRFCNLLKNDNVFPSIDAARKWMMKRVKSISQGMKRMESRNRHGFTMNSEEN